MDEYLFIQVQYFGKLSLVQEKLNESFTAKQGVGGGNSLGRQQTFQTSPLLSWHTQVYLRELVCSQFTLK